MLNIVHPSDGHLFDCPQASFIRFQQMRVEARHHQEHQPQQVLTKEEAIMATQTLVRPSTPELSRPPREQSAPSMRVRLMLEPALEPALEPRSTTYAVRAPRPAPVAPKSGVRITRRGRITLLLLLTALALLLGALLQSGAPAVASPDGPSGAVTRTVTVGPGETLWQIARDVRPNADPRETVARIQELNGLTTATVWAGQPLIVPA